MSCNDVSTRCAKKVNSACTVYEGILPSDTSINPNSCEISVEEVLKDMSVILTKISNEINFDSIKQGNLGDQCFNYFNLPASLSQAPETSANYVTIREAVKTLEIQLQNVMDFIGMACPGCSSCEDCPKIYEQSIACLNLTIPGADACGNTPSTLEQLLQYILNKLP
jgi:hypothetical protein